MGGAPAITSQKLKYSDKLTSYTQLIVMADAKFALNQLQDPSKSISIQTDLLFVYSKGDVVVSGQIKPLTLLNTCTIDEESEVFSFVQS